MKKLLLIPMLALAGCQATPAQIAAYEDECRANGAQNDFQVFQCRVMLEERDRAQRERIGNALQALAAASAPPPQPVYQPMRTTTCQRIGVGIGQQVQCTTW